MKEIWEQLKTNRAILYMFTAGIGLTFGMFVIFFEDIFLGTASWALPEYCDEPQKEFFNHHPKFLLWTFLIILQAGVFMVLINPLLRGSHILRDKFKIPASEWWITYVWGVIVSLGTIFFVAEFVGRYFLAGPAWPQEYFPLTNGGTKLIILNVVGYSVALMSLAGMMVIARSSVKLNNLNASEIVESYAGLRRSLRFYVLALGIQVGLATLSTASLQKAIFKLHPDTEMAPFPIEFVWAYGMFLTIMILIVYIPVNQRLMVAGRKIRAAFLAGELEINMKGNDKSIEEELGIAGSWKQTAEMAFAIILPLIGAIAPGMFGLG